MAFFWGGETKHGVVQSPPGVRGMGVGQGVSGPRTRGARVRKVHENAQWRSPLTKNTPTPCPLKGTPHFSIGERY